MRRRRGGARRSGQLNHGREEWRCERSRTSSTASSGPRAGGATEPVLNPATGEEIAQAPLSDAQPTSTRPSARPRGARSTSWSQTTPGRAREALLGLADAIEEHGEELAREEAINAGKPLAAVLQRRDRRDGRQPALLRRRRALHGGQGRGRVHGGLHLVDPPRAGRRGRPDRAVELPADDGGVEDRPGARDRLHDRAQAGRDDARSRRCASPSSPPRSCPPACSTSICGHGDAGRRSRSSSTPTSTWSR